MTEGDMTGLTKTAGWQIGVSRTVRVPQDEAWRFLTGEGLALWLGTRELGPVGSRWTSAQAGGELRTITPPSRLRLTHRAQGADHETTIQITLRSKPAGTTIVFHEERMSSARERELARAHWTEVGSTVVRCLGGRGSA